MAGAWRRITQELMATFRVEGCLDAKELEGLSGDLRVAADAGFHHLVLDLRGSCEQSLDQWSALRPVVDELTRRGARLSVQGATPDLHDGLRSLTIEAQMRVVERSFPEFFNKPLK